MYFKHVFMEQALSYFVHHDSDDLLHKVIKVEIRHIEDVIKNNSHSVLIPLDSVAQPVHAHMSFTRTHQIRSSERPEIVEVKSHMGKYWQPTQCNDTDAYVHDNCPMTCGICTGKYKIPVIQRV